ncbi:SusC/RagA family TonB-linked outer membrane protein, partial [Bacteroides salyersiae]
MNKYKIILIIFFSILSLSNLMAQKGGIKVSGKVVSSYANRPLPDAIITISGVDKTVECDSLGRFSVDGVPAKATISVWCPGFYTKEEPVANREQVQIVMIPEDMKGYSEKVTLPFRGMVVQKNKSTNLSSVSKNGLNLNLTDVEEGFRNIPGLQLISKSGQSQ